MQTAPRRHPKHHLRQQYTLLTPELRRAADWVLAHPAEVGLWSMRRQAQALDVSPATMLRLARAVGYPSYDSFRAPFQKALSTTVGSRVQTLQTAHRTEVAPQLDSVTRQQLDAVASTTRLNSPAAFDEAATLLLQARQVAFLGIRACYGIAYQLHYAYHFLKNNGAMLCGLGGTLEDHAHDLGPADVLVSLGLAPYSRTTVNATQSAAARGVPIIALTDSETSPLASHARCSLLFHPETASATPSGSTFMHSTTGMLSLAEHLMTRVAALGGQSVLERAEDIDTRLYDIQAYWQPPIAPAVTRKTHRKSRA